MKTLLQRLIENQAVFERAQAETDTEKKQLIINLVKEILKIQESILDNKFDVDSLDLIVNFYLMAYINRYNYEGVKSFIESRINWEKDFSMLKEKEIDFILENSLSDLLYAASALYKAGIKNKGTSLFVLKPLFDIVGILNRST